jgi:hypothetical protein
MSEAEVTIMRLQGKWWKIIDKLLIMASEIERWLR